MRNLDSHDSLRVGVVQMRTGPDPWENLLQVDGWVREAEALGCQLLCFPENVFYRGPRLSSPTEFFLRIDPPGKQIIQDSPWSTALAEFAAHWRISVSLGSVWEHSHEVSRPYNSHWILKPGGGLQATYRKIHLFSFQGNHHSYNEAADYMRGQIPVTTPVGDFRLGLSICFDLRFPEIYRHLVLQEEANLLLVPSAFTQETGNAHWHLLLRARAVENLSYVVAAAQWGEHLDHNGRKHSCFGHSLVVDPWGQVLAEATGRGDQLLVAEIHPSEVERWRCRMPALQMRGFK